MHDLTLGELPLFDILERLYLGDDSLVSIDAVLLTLVREDTLNHVATVFSSDLVPVLSNLSIGATVLDQTFGSTETVVSSSNSISSAGTCFTIANNNGVSSVNCETIDVGTANNLSDFTSLKYGRLVSKRRVVADNVVDGDTAWEGNTAIDLLGLLTIVDLLEFSFDKSINLLADGVDISFRFAKRDSMLHSGYKHIKY